MRPTNESLYPAQIAEEVRERWAAAGRAAEVLPAPDALSRLLDIAYQASLLREETQLVRCRLILASPFDFEGVFSAGTERPVICRFDAASALTAHEIRKLATAAGYYRALLGVGPDAAGTLKIWGMVFTGTHWLDRVDGGRLAVNELPHRLVVHILAPGRLRVACGHERVLETSTGILLYEGFDPFRSRWLPRQFREVRQALVASAVVPESGARTSTAVTICDNFVRDAAQSVVRRALGLVRSRGHGGLLAMVSATADPSAIDRWFRFRVRFQPDSGARRYQTLMRQLLERLLFLGQAAGLEKITWHEYRSLHDPALADMEQQLIEFTHVLADLMSVDGALVLDRTFRIIGFGGEILGDQPVARIHRALDLEADRTVDEPADSSGTRHRSAYRFVDGMRDALAVVVSQDGAVSFVAHHRDRLTYWPYLP